jgi:peptide deformylase
MAVGEVLLLGNPKLYEISEFVEREELDKLEPILQDLHDTLMDFKKKYGAGRAIAAPQIGLMKRLVYMVIDKPIVFINPELSDRTKETMVVWDDCMCFPDLLVKVERHQRCRITYKDMKWKEDSIVVEGSLSELLQHECDHLDGVLAVSRAIDGHSFALKSQKKYWNFK